VTVLLTGGSACGKSSYGEVLAAAAPRPVYYIATMRPYGEEGEAKIARHRALRAGKGFETVERYTDLASLRLPRRGSVLLECLANLTANEIFDPDGSGENAADAVMRGIENLRGQCETLILITNDVGSDGGGYSPETMHYVRTLGEINRRAAAMADEVYELVCGIALRLK